MLGALERLASDANATEDNVAAIRRMADLDALFAGYVIEEVQCRLDRTFLEVITDGHSAFDIFAGADNEKELAGALEGELESLFPEIGVLAEMSTRRQFIQPIMRELKIRYDQSCAVSHRKLEYV